VIGTLVAGLLLTAAVTASMAAIFGSGAVLPAAGAGVLATLIQLVAVRALRRGLTGGTTDFFKAFGIGTALRMAGVVLVLVAVLVDRETFPPLATAFGYLGVVVPLLFLEVRFVR
jgi:hypothetical protein